MYPGVGNVLMDESLVCTMYDLTQPDRSSAEKSITEPGVVDNTFQNEAGAHECTYNQKQKSKQDRGLM